LPRFLTCLVLVCSFLAARPAVAGDGCTPGQAPGCGGCACQSCVCGTDAYCCSTAWDDICVQECTDCGGCGGGGTTPGGGIQPCGSCGNISYEGCCNGQVVQFCDGGQLMCLDCSANPSCGWSAQAGYYDCGTPGSPDPSGANPMQCGGGGINPPAGYCGDGACGAGENATNCPQDCGGGPCTPSCAGKACGDNGCGGTCGACGFGYYCDISGQCIDESCEPNCSGKQCGEDGCGGMCGSCPIQFTCNNSQCVPAGVGPAPGDSDVQSPAEGDVECTPSCYGKLCGDDGCGGTCGACPAGYGCNEQYLCEEGYVPPSASPYLCGAGLTLMYGKCVPVAAESAADSGGCTAGPRSPLSGWMLLAGLALLAAARRATTSV
jgi:hypothetical protein